MVIPKRKKNGKRNLCPLMHGGVLTDSSQCQYLLTFQILLKSADEIKENEI